MYEEQKSTYETLKGSVSLLPDVTAAQETFKKFETTSGVIERLGFDLLKVITAASLYFFDVPYPAVTNKSCPLW